MNNSTSDKILSPDAAPFRSSRTTAETRPLTVDAKPFIPFARTAQPITTQPVIGLNTPSTLAKPPTIGLNTPLSNITLFPTGVQQTLYQEQNSGVMMPIHTEKDLVKKAMKNMSNERKKHKDKSMGRVCISDSSRYTNSIDVEQRSTDKYRDFVNKTNLTFRATYTFNKNSGWRKKAYENYGRECIRHENFLQIEGRDSKSDGTVVIPSEYVDGGSLERYIEIFDELLSDTKISEERYQELIHHRLQFCKGVVLQLFEALFYLEFVLTSKTPHRNINPKSILINTDGYIKLRPTDCLDKDHMLHNRYHYIDNGYVDPEHRDDVDKRLSSDHKNDVWAIGAIAYSIMRNTSLLPEWKEEDITMKSSNTGDLVCKLSKPSETFNSEIDYMVLGDDLHINKEHIADKRNKLRETNRYVDDAESANDVIYPRLYSLHNSPVSTRETLIKNDNDTNITSSDIADIDSLDEVSNRKNILEQLLDDHIQRNNDFLEFTKLDHEDEEWDEVFPDSDLRDLVKMCFSESSSRPTSSEALGFIYSCSRTMDEIDISKKPWKVLKTSTDEPNFDEIMEYVLTKCEYTKYTGIELQKKPKHSTLLAEVMKFNSMPIAVLSAERYNLHSLLSIRENLLCVPYPTQEIYNTIIESKHEYGQEYRSLFIGQLPLVVNENLINTMIKSITGVVPKRIFITESAKNSSGNYTSPLVVVNVLEKDAFKVMACLHRRVMIDQTSFYVAVTDEQVLLMYRYSMMLYRRRDARFQQRPYAPITVTLANPEGTPHRSPPVYNNIFNPMCKCDGCRAFYYNCLNYDYLFKEYLPLVNTIPPENFYITNLIETHAYVFNKNSLSSLQSMLYTEVSNVTRVKVVESVSKLWDKFRNTMDKDDYWEMVCRNTMPDHGPVAQGGKGVEHALLERPDGNGSSMKSEKTNEVLQELINGQSVNLANVDKVFDVKKYIHINERVQGWTFTDKQKYNSWSVGSETDIAKFVEQSMLDNEDLASAITEYIEEKGQNLSYLRSDAVKTKDKQTRKSLERMNKSNITEREAYSILNCSRAMCYVRNGYLGSAVTQGQIDHVEARYHTTMCNINDCYTYEYIPEVIQLMEKEVQLLVFRTWLNKLLEQSEKKIDETEFENTISFLIQEDVTPLNFSTTVNDRFFNEFLTKLPITKQTQNILVSIARHIRNGFKNYHESTEYLYVTNIFPKNMILDKTRCIIGRRVAKFDWCVIHHCSVDGKMCDMRIYTDNEENHDVVKKAEKNYRCRGSPYIVELVGVMILSSADANKYINKGDDGSRLAIVLEHTECDVEKLQYGKISSEIDVPRIYKYCSNLADGLAHVHRQNGNKESYIYVNLKQPFIKITTNDMIKINCLRDFKEVKVYNTTNLTLLKPKFQLTKTDRVIDTLLSSAKSEQSHITHDYDVFMFGCFLYNLIYGAPADFTDLSLKQTVDRNYSVVDSATGLKTLEQSLYFSVLIRICYHCLKVSQEQRPDNGIVLSMFLKEASVFDLARYNNTQSQKATIASCDISLEQYEALTSQQKDHLSMFLSVDIIDPTVIRFNHTLKHKTATISLNVSKYECKLPNRQTAVNVTRTMLVLLNPISNPVNQIYFADNVVDNLLLKMRGGMYTKLYL